MSRPTAKADLLSAAHEQYDKLMQLIGSMSEAERNETFSFEDRDRNVRDVLVHLREWHRLMPSWVESNENGVVKPFLPPPYNWKTYQEMNRDVIWQAAQGVSLDEALRTLDESHAGVVELLERFGDEQLFTKSYYKWTGGSTLGSYFTSVLSSHYVWAQKKIKRHIKEILTLK